MNSQGTVARVPPLRDLLHTMSEIKSKANPQVATQKELEKIIEALARLIVDIIHRESKPEGTSLNSRNHYDDSTKNLAESSEFS